jgi:hypothetical protein
MHVFKQYVAYHTCAQCLKCVGAYLAFATSTFTRR